MKSGQNWSTAARPKAHERIVDFVMSNGASGATADMIAVLLRTSTSQARQRLEALVHRKTLVRQGDRYFLAHTREASRDS